MAMTTMTVSSVVSHSVTCGAWVTDGTSALKFQYDWADLEITDADTGGTASFDEIARLKLIVGYELGQGMVYGSGGVAYGSLDNAGDVFDGFDGSDTNWVLGFGYDHRVGDDWTVGGEYQYHDFDDLNVNTLHLKAAYRF